MKATHTPGPWHVSDRHPNRACIEIVTDGAAFAVASLFSAPGDAKSEHEAHDGIWRGDYVRVANARLIASAPDLLKACEVAAELLLSAKTEAAYEVLLSTIQKARGE